jgi:4-alpha-glucanotransferase
MNTPGQAEGNWSWRYWYGALTGDVRHRLKSMTETFGRAG